LCTSQEQSAFRLIGIDGRLTVPTGSCHLLYANPSLPSSHFTGAESLQMDAHILAQTHPELFSFGGNTGQPNTFTGVDISDLTGGVYNAKTLFEGNNFACFFFQVMQSQITGRLNLPPLQPLLDYLKSLLQPLLAPLACPQLTKYNQTMFELFPSFVSGQPKET
jgi:hypothetical protein